MDYNRLSGPKKKIVREALIKVFVGPASLDTFMSDSDLGSLANHVPQTDYDSQVSKLIQVLSGRGQLSTLIENAKQEHPESPYLIDLDTRLQLFDHNEKEQRAVKNKGGLERLVRNCGFADPYSWSTSLLETGRRVCRISYEVSPNAIVYGTGFLIKSDRVLTNYHVIEHLMPGKSGDPAKVTIFFKDIAGAEGELETRRCGLFNNGNDDEWRIGYSRYSEADLRADAGTPNANELDYAEIRLDQPVGDDLGPEGKRGWVDISQAPLLPEDGSIVFILQHPSGQPIKQSIGVTVQSVTPLRLRYDADTLGGSSGGIVLNQLLEPLALHHAGDPTSKIKAEYNQGIPLHLINDDRKT